MKKSLMIVSSLLPVALLAACDRQAETPQPAEPASAASSGMSGMSMAGQMMHGGSTGTVTAIDAAKGTITLDHGAIAELEWQPMTMSFAVGPELLSDIKVGDNVSFEIDWDGQAGTVTKIGKVGS